MSIEVVRLDLGSIDGPIGPNTPFHGYALKHPKGVVLVDTGWGGPTDRVPNEWNIVPRAMADALADHDLSPVDVAYVMTTHLHQDHYGQNVVFREVPFIVQRSELERARRESPHMLEYFDFAGASFELVDGDAEVLPGIHALATPGHTCGHQSVLVDDGQTRELIVGDAAYTHQIWNEPAVMSPDHPAWAIQVQGDLDDWRASLERLHQVQADRFHFCHDRVVLDAATAQR